MKTALDVHRELLAREVRHEMVRVRGRLSCADDLPRMLDLTHGCGVVRCFTVTSPAVTSPAVTSPAVTSPAETPPADRGVVAVLVAAGTDPDPGALRTALGVQALRPSTADEVNAATGFAAGLVSPVCLPATVPLLVEASIAARHVLYTAAGEGGVALGIRTRDLLRATGALVAALAPAAPAPGAPPPGAAPHAR